MVVNSELVRRVDRMLENLPVRGFQTVLHVMVVIAALKERDVVVPLRADRIGDLTNQKSTEI